MNRIRVGIIGSGSIAGAHAGEYYDQQPAEAELIAIAEPNPATREQFAAAHNVPNAYATVEELLARPDIDYVDICTPPDTHPGLIRTAAKFGKNVLCEKPLATDYVDAARAITDAEQAGIKVGVLQNYRFRPEYIDARNMLASGFLGKPFMATMQALYHWHGGSGYRRHSEKMLILEVGYHYVDLLRYLVGEDVVRVYAAGGRSRMSPAAGDTYAAITLHFASGAIGNLVNSGECFGSKANWGGEAIVQAEEGTVYINHKELFTLSVYSPASGGMMETSYSRDNYGLFTNPKFSRPLSAFLGAAQQGKELPVTGRDNLNTLSTILAAYESVATGEAVDIAEFTSRGREPSVALSS